LQQVKVCPIDIPTAFRDFDDYWSPFLGGQGPAPGYARSLSEARRGRSGIEFVQTFRLPTMDRYLLWLGRGPFVDGCHDCVGKVEDTPAPAR
jgi:hypothetical protein